jgi:hypothetical protein
MNWYIGQPIVAIRNHSQGAFRKNQEFKICGLRVCPCGCKSVNIDIGRRSGNEWLCLASNYTEKTPVWWFNEGNFAPLDQDISELTEILEQPIECRPVR